MLTLEEYATQLRNSGSRVVVGSQGTFWLEAERYGMIRMPTFHTTCPRADELRQVFRLGRAGVASYLLDPTDRFPANAFLYVCRDRDYRL